MLELRPCCEHCGVDLPPHSAHARVCSYECTFCAHCAEQVLHGICPNCGGNFSPRPIRPAQAWQGGNSLQAHPATTVRLHRPVIVEQHAQLISKLASIAPQDR